MTIAFTDHLKVADEILSTKMEQETIILNLKTGMYHGLDPVGTRFFELLESAGDLAEVHRQLLAEFDVSPDRLEKDLLSLSQEMLSKGVLIIAKS
jgi:Coenzyme PQQ synthesis protein D (PqqD)